MKTNGEAWTEEMIPDLSGLVAIVTGANSGLGYETVRALASKGAAVTLCARNSERGEQAAGRIRGLGARGTVEVAALDLAALSNVAAFCERFAGTHDRLDLLVNNAGIMAPPRSETADGFEMQFGVNHLAHFALTGGLFPLLSRTTGGRVVTVSSTAAYYGRIDFDDLQGRRRYGRYGAYGQSKLANLLFAFELGRRSEDAGRGVKSMAAHPGLAYTELQRHTVANNRSAFERWIYSWVMPAFSQPQAMGVLPQLRAATDTAAAGGSFFGPRKIAKGPPVLVRPPRRALDEAVAGRLWEVSEELTGVRYP